MSLDLILQIITIISGALSTILILLQQRGATLGAGLSASSELHIERRGVEKNVFEATVILATIFVLSIIAMLVVPK